MVPTREDPPTLSLIVLNAGAMAVAVVAARGARLGGGTGPLVLGTLCGYLIVVHSVVLLAGLRGNLGVGGVAMLLVIALAGALWLTHRARRGRALPRIWATARDGDGGTNTAASVGDRACLALGTAPDHVTAAVLFPPLVALAGGVVWAWPHLFQATRLWIWDDYTYHMVYPALWLREHAIAAVAPAQGFTMQAWYPLSASVVATWFMLPFPESRGDALAWVSLTGVLYGGIVAAGCVELLRRLQCRRHAWAVPIVLLATSPRIAIMASSFSDADLAVAATLFAALVVALPRGESELGREIAIDGVLAGLLTGMALGVKVSAATQALIIAAMLALRAAGSSLRVWARVRAVLGIGLVMVAGWTVTAGYWYARNVVHTGNPFYPAALLGWKGTTFPETTLLEYGRQYGLRRALDDALAVYLNWPRLHAVLAIGGLIGLAAWLPLHRRPLTRSRRYFAWGALTLAAATLALLPVAPYSAGNAMTFRSGFIHWDSMRYVALLPILGWAALGFLIDAGAGASAWRTIGAVGVAIAASLASAAALVAPAALAVLAIAAALMARAWPLAPMGQWNRIRSPAAGFAVGALVVAALVVGVHSTKATATAAAFHKEPLFGHAAEVLDRQPAGARVAVFGDQWVYPTFGARHHLRPVRLDGDGRIATGPILDAMAPGPLTVDPAAFRANLRASGIEIVVVIHLPHPGRSPEWPTQQEALESVGDAVLLHRDGAVAVWTVDR
jgi:hypothetical protein